jgi:ribosomal protein S19
MIISKLNKLIELDDIGKLVCVYNGKKWVLLRLLERMLFHFIGEFIITKKQGSSIHKIKLKIKNKKKIRNK